VTNANRLRRFHPPAADRRPSAAAVAQRVERSLSRGAIVLLHDAEINPGSTERVTEALPRIATALGENGWSAVPLGELMSV